MMEDIMDLVYRVDDLEVIDSQLSSHNRDTLEQSDANGFDLLHHCIIANNLDVAIKLWKLGCFIHVNPSQPLPYIHLACLVGRAPFIQQLLSNRSMDELSITTKGRGWINVDAISSCLRKTPNSADQFLQACECFPADDDEEEVLTPLDTAAIAGHVRCVNALLLMDTRAKSNGLEKVVELGSHRALGLLLQDEDEHYPQAEIDAAFKSALRRKEAECLDLLLKQGARPLKAFSPFNPFHVLYLYCSGYQRRNAQERNEGLDQCTLVLLRNGFPVNVREPLGTYPLYSVIHAIVTEKDQFPNKIPTYHIKALEHLLMHGADPNFDEVLQERAQPESSFSSTLGRDLFSSALNALFSMLQTSDSYRAHQAEHLDRSCLMILEHGADPNHLNSHGEAPLHDALKALAMQHAIGHMQVDFSSMVRMLLYFGADPNKPSTGGQYAVHAYFVTLLNLMGGLIAFTRWKQADNAAQVLQLLFHMETSHACQAAHQLMHTLEQGGALTPPPQDDSDEEPNTSDEEHKLKMPPAVLEYVQELIAEFIQKPKTLQDYSRIAIWTSIGRNKDKLKLLPLPRGLGLAVLDMFDLDLDF